MKMITAFVASILPGGTPAARKARPEAQRADAANEQSRCLADRGEELIRRFDEVLDLSANASEDEDKSANGHHH